MTSTPLAGIRVLDLTNVLAGPFCTHQLAHLGAEVIKVEPRGRGDLARALGADEDLNRKLMGTSFLAQNAGKKSVTINLKNAGGKAVFERLATGADVLVENFRPGVMDRLGVGYADLKPANPQLVYCAISGFGQDGPWAHRPAYDQIVQGAGGVMSVTGTEDTGPLRVGFPISDTLGGLTAAMAICAALNAEPRGTFIDVSMLESTLSAMGWAVSNYLVAGQAPQPAGNENLTSAPSAAFQAADGYINIAANKDEQWALLARHLGRPELLEDPDFADREHRKRNRGKLKAELESVLSTRPARDWARELSEIGVPAGAVFTVPDILDHPQVRERGMIATYDNVPETDAPVRVLRTGVKLDSEAPAVAAAPPQLGQHTDQVLSGLGYTPEEIADLRKDGAI